MRGHGLTPNAILHPASSIEWRHVRGGLFLYISKLFVGGNQPRTFCWFPPNPLTEKCKNKPPRTWRHSILEAGRSIAIYSSVKCFQLQIETDVIAFTHTSIMLCWLLCTHVLLSTFTAVICSDVSLKFGPFMAKRCIFYYFPISILPFTLVYENLVVWPSHGKRV